MNLQIEEELEDILAWETIQAAFKRSAKKRLGGAWNKSESNLAWGQPQEIADELEQLNQRLSAGTVLAELESVVESFKQLRIAFAQTAEGRDLSLASVLEGLCLAYHLNRFGDDENGEEFVSALLSAFTQENQFAPLSIPETGTQLLISQLVHVEFPLVVVAQCSADLPEIEFGRLVSETCRRYEELLDANVDGDGWVESRYFEQFWQLTASWSRSFQLLQRLGVPVGTETRQQLEWICRQFLRSMGPDGRQMLGPSDQRAASLGFQELVVGLSLDRVDKKLARLRDPNRDAKKKDDINLTLFDESGFSEWASSGVFQTGWGSYSPRIAVTSDKTNLAIEIAARVSLIRGRSEPRVWFNDEQLAFFQEEHEIRCWHSDEAVEYVEFEYQLEHGATFERQVLLCREDHFAIVGDAICFAETGEIQYEHRLPLSPGISALRESETREVYLKDSQIRSLVLPLGLGEWQADGMNGSLDSDADQLVLKQSCIGRAIYAPLLFDLSPLRSKRPRTWRHLTVAEDRENLRKDQAAAFRVQIGKEQWLVYRSLDGTGNRTFMGENHICEFFVGRTEGDTEADELIQIE